MAEKQGSAVPQPSDSAPAEGAQGGSTSAISFQNGTVRETPGETLITPKGVSTVKLALTSMDNVDTVKVVVSGGEGADFRYAWTKNSEPAGEGDSISGFKRGDKIAVTVTPFAGKVAGQPKTMGLEIANSVPKVVEGKQIGFDGKILTAQVKATDPDGDTVSYSLKDAPQGLTIDQATGIVTWEVPRDFHGKQTITVKISDGHGGEAVYGLNVDVSETNPPEKQK